MEVREVVSGPGCQQLRHRDGPQRRMPSAKFKFCLAQIHRLEVGEIGGAQLGKFIQQLPQRLSQTHLDVARHIERLEGLPLALLQDKPGARHPIRLFAVDQVADDIKDGPCALTFVPHGPRFRQIPQERIERGRSAASTSFANPAITIARSLSDTFPGIRPADVAAFIAAQLVGALLALWVARSLFGTATARRDASEEVVSTPLRTLEAISSDQRR